MKLVNKDTIARFSNQAYDVQSMMALMGRQPHHIAGYIRHRKQFNQGLMAITEGLGNVYMEDMSNLKKLEDIDTFSFTWDVETSQIPVIRITRDLTEDGSTGGLVTIFMESRYFSKYDIFALENTQQLYVVSEPEKVGSYEFAYTCKVITTPRSGNAIQLEYARKNRTARYLYNAHTEWSEFGSTKQHYQTERHINWMTKIRADQEYSNDFRATEDLYFMSESDIRKAADVRGGTYKIFKLDSVEQQVLDHFILSANNSLLFGRSSMDERTGRSNIQINNNQDVIMGDGLIASYERYAQYIDYNRLSVRDFQDAIEFIVDKRGESQGNHITVIHNRRFSRQKANALQEAIQFFAPQNNGTWFFGRDEGSTGSDHYDGMARKAKLAQKNIPNPIKVGATFNTYIYEGNTITFVEDSALTSHYRDRGYAIFVDTGLYEDEKGQVPGVHLKTLKGRALVKSHITGIGGIDGTTSGIASNAADGGRFVVLGWRGICVRNPYAAVIFEENIEL